MSDTTSPPSVRLHPLSSSPSTDSAPQSEPTSDEQPDLGAFTTVLRAWTYLQPPPRIPVQIHSQTTSTTTTFQPDQSVVDTDFQSNRALPPSSSSFTRPQSGSVLHEDSTLDSHALPQSFSSFTRPTSSSVPQEESTVWNHAPIASYLYSETPSIDLEDENSVISTEGGRTVEINSEWSFDERSSLAPSQPPSDVAVPVLLAPSLLLPESDSPALTSHLRTNLLFSSDTVSYSSDLSPLSYQIPESQDSDQDLLVAQRTTISTTSLKSQRSSIISNSMNTPTFGPFLAIPQHQTVLIHPPSQTISDDASVSHLSLPPTDPPLPPVPYPNPIPHNKQPPPISLPQPQPKLGIGTSISSLTRGIDGDGQGTIVVDDLRTPDQTPDFLVDWKRGGKTGGFRPVDDDREEDRKTRAYGLGFGFGRVPQGWGHGQKHVSGYTSNYEGSQSSFRTRKSSEMRSRSTRLEPQREDNEDSNFNSDLAEQHDTEDQDEEEEEEGDHYPFPRYRRRSGEFHFETHTPRYYGHRTPPTGVLPTQPPPQLQSVQQIRSQSSMGVLRGLAHPDAQPQPTDSRQQFYSQYSHLDSYPDPYPRPHARPHVQDRHGDIYSSRSHSPMSSPRSLSPSPSQLEPSPIQRDYVLIPQSQLPKQSYLEQTQRQTRSQLQQSQSQPQLQLQTQTSHSVSYQNHGLSIYSSTTTTALSSVPFLIPPSVAASAVSAIPPSSFTAAVSVPASSYSNLHQTQGTVTSEDHHDSILLLSSNNHVLPLPPPSSLSTSSSALPSKTIEKDFKPVSNSGTGNKLGEPDHMKRVSWEYVDLKEEDDELVSVSERCSSGDGGGSGLGVEHRPSPKVQQPLLTKQQQPLTQHTSMNQQQRRQLELQYQQSDVQVRLHVELDSDGSEDGATTVGASVLVSEPTAAAPSVTVSNTDEDQPLNLNPILHPPSPNSSANPDREPSVAGLIPNSKFDLPNDHSNHSHTHSSNLPHSQSPSHHHFHSSYPGFHSVSHVAHIEDMTESELELDLNLEDGLRHDRDIEVSAIGTTVQRVGGGEGGGDDALPSLGYLDEALSFIAEERARWSAAREGGAVGAGGNESDGGPDESTAAAARVAKGGAEKTTEDWKVLDHDMEPPKRKRRRKRRQQSQPPQQGLPKTTQLLHTGDEDGGPSTSTSSAKKKEDSNSKRKEKEKEFLIAPQLVASARSSLSSTAVLIQEADRSITGVGGSGPVDTVSINGSRKKHHEVGRTPSNGAGGEDAFGPIITGSKNLSGKRSKKMGKKERERERVRKDLMIGRSIGKGTRDVTYEEDVDNEGDNDENGEEEDDVSSHDDLSLEDTSSLNNLSLLQPPQTSRRKKGKDIAHIHSKAGIAGAYKSTPGSPKTRREFDILIDPEGGGEHGQESLGDVDVEDNAVGGGGGGGAPDVGSVGKTRKRLSSKRRKGLVRVRSVPLLDAEDTRHAAEETVITPAKSKSKKAKAKVAAASTSAPIPPTNVNAGVDLPDMDQPQTKLSRLIAFAKELRQFFPEQRQELRKVTLRFEKQVMEPREKSRKAFLTSDAIGVGGSIQSPPKSIPIPVPGARKSKQSIHHRSGSESVIVDINEEDAARMPEVEEDEEELDPRGRPPKKGDVLVHVFIDHSNILIGLLSHLKRISLSQAAQTKGTNRVHPLPTISAKTTPTVSMSPVTTSALAFAAVKPTSTRPLPDPNSTTSANGKSNSNTSSPSSIPLAVPGDYHHRIPLPSFATMSRSLPSGSALNGYLVENDNESQIKEKDVHSVAHEYHQGEDEVVDDLGQITSLVKAWKPNQKEKKPVKHLWHAALVLLLERGRSVTRRVVVASSPLYQAMDEIKRLGYELRVYARVPDLGDGMDRDRRRDSSTSFSGASKSVQSSPANPVSFSGIPGSLKKNKKQMLGHVRHISDGMSAESGSGGSGNTSGGASNLHPYHGIANNTPSLGKIKYREQGVDELLQLKLHQALAATDVVPEGSTIVLATGDGNIGQFNEEGFLGPIRTALRRGWKVELYAWEDGLSRAWRREFGEGTEWSRKGMFRVIGMEQFAASLVEVVDL